MSGVLKVHAEPGIVPLGPPIANTRFYVVDSAGQVLPPGVPGELYISGTGVSPGYVERPVITRERFLPDPWSGAPDAHMFRTGDIVRLVNGNNFELKPQYIPLLPKFHGMDSEDTYLFLTKFEEV